MTPYAESLIEYAMWFGKRSRADAIKLLDDNASPLWRMSTEQPKAHNVTILEDNGDD